ncbi:MAG: glucose 1-dehydrogenase [Azospirillaceae bacterium]
MAETASDPFDLTGRTALVIGGGGGLGGAIARGLAARGARVAISGRRQDRLDAVAAEIGGGAAGFAADVTDIAAIAPLFEAVEAAQGPLDILVNSQGTTDIKPAIEFDEADYDRVVDTNLKSVFFCSTEAGRRMAGRGQGAIVNIASLAAHYGWANATPYAISKAGVVALTQSLAAEWGRSGVRVNAISPGFVMTEMNSERMSDERKAEARKRAALDRFGEADEMIGAAVYLASPAAAFVTGAVLRVDGGFLASGI